MKHSLFFMLLLTAAAASAQNYIVPYGVQVGAGSSQAALLRVGAEVWKGIGIGVSIANTPFLPASPLKPSPLVAGELFYSTKIPNSAFHLYLATVWGYHYYTTTTDAFLADKNTYSQGLQVNGVSLNAAANVSYEINLPKKTEGRKFYTTLIPVLGFAYTTSRLSGKGTTFSTGDLTKYLQATYLNFGGGIRFTAQNFHFGFMLEEHQNGGTIRDGAITVALGAKLY